MALSVSELVRALSLRDLTDPAQGPHAMQLLLDAIHAALPVPVRVHRGSPIVSIADNYDRLSYPPGGAARDARYTRYVCESAVLRTQTSAMIPPLLAGVTDDTVLSCPGLVYRRDVIDKHHVGEPHQVDLWRIARVPLDERDLDDMIARVVGAALPGRRWTTQPALHPYTRCGRQIDVDGVEIGECGLAAITQPGQWGLAMGLGLDRLLMLRKGIDDIRLLRATDPRIADQMLDLAPYRPVSMMPAVQRDLSIATEPLDGEALGDRVRAVLGERAELLESCSVLSATPAALLPPAARARLGIADDQHNLLIRLVLRAIDRTLTHEECNALRDDVYAALHQGRVHTWADPRNRARAAVVSRP